MPNTCVLIVGDEVGQTETLRLYVKDLPLEVQVAESAAAASHLLGRQRFHAVLCDLAMPGGGARRSSASCGARGSALRLSS